MVNKKKIEAFINYEYIPITRPKIIKRILLMWLLSFILCIIGKRLLIWIVPFAVLNIAFTVVHVIFFIRINDSKIYTFLSEGIFSVFLCVVLNFASYRVLVTQYGSHIWLAFVLFIPALVFLILFFYLAYQNIKADKFSSAGMGGKIAVPGAIFGVLGITIARFFAPAISEQSAYILIASILLLVGTLFIAGAIFLLKAYLYQNEITPGFFPFLDKQMKRFELFR